MSDKFNIIPFAQLLQIILTEEKSSKSVFGIPNDLFITNSLDTIATQIFNQKLDIPLGVAAGPHSQMAQNIITAWLCGARYIELKTIQTLDELDVSKPCIDMQDEGYNCEWSQELKIKESFNQYLEAWVIIHVLNHKYNNKKQLSGTIFNMSVGYNLEGILQDNVQWFLSKMHNCEAEIAQKKKEIEHLYPAVNELEIPACISNNITLSTMHGCPPKEIEQIASYLIENKGFHTYVKLNPTLLGTNELRTILNETNKFTTNVPDEAFGHDLKYADAIPMIKSLAQLAKEKGVEFGLKLTNTLESVNHKGVFSEKESMMYMSGRALHPLSIKLAHKLQHEFNGLLNISFAGGADCFNFSDILACGLTPVTVCSDILKPGGYGRLPQYITEMQQDMLKQNANNIDEYILNKSGLNSLIEAKLANLDKYVEKIKNLDLYKRNEFKYPSIKTDKKLSFFDCISAPCQTECATKQDIPDYLHFTAKGDFNKAFESILRRNSQPAITGHICDHLCQTKCTRINYDDPLLIREIKRFVEEKQSIEALPTKLPYNGNKVAIIGAGPSGLACAYYLLLSGFTVDIFEQKNKVGGMVSGAVPFFRLDDNKINDDIQRVKDLGGNFHFNFEVDQDIFNSFQKEYDFNYVAVGAQKSTKLNIMGIEADGVLDALDFLHKSRLQQGDLNGKHVAIIGGGNSAMDAARSAYRLVGKNGSVSIIYRRTIEDMPADLGEIKAVIEEGIEIIEKVSPLEVITNENKVSGIKCIKNNLVESSGRPKPIAIKGSEFDLAYDIIIPAIGQDKYINFLDEKLLKAHPNTLETKIKNVFIGGDAYRGAATAIKAIADGRNVAERIIERSGNKKLDFKSISKELSSNDLLKDRFVRKKGMGLKESPVNNRQNFNPVSFTLSETEAKTEAARCLQCDLYCGICSTVCPNRANYSYEIELVKYNLQKAKIEGEEMQIIQDKVFEVKQKYQVLNIADWCNECGNCTTFCPTNSAPFRDKPKFHLTIKGFNESSEGYYLSKLQDKTILINKEQGGIRTLELVNKEWIYETDHVFAKFRQSDFSIIEAKFKTPCVKQAHFAVAAEMSVLYKAVENLY